MNTSLRSFLLCFVLGAGVSTFCLWQLHGAYGFNLADEGFFWYGAQQTAQGEVPGLDFRAYEPGRYYWAAAVFKALASNSNASARIASTLFGSLSFGLIVGFLVSTRKGLGGVKALLAVVFFSATLSVWTFPYYRITDIVAPCSVFILCYQLYANRYLATSLFAGIGLGILMFFGRNHALYGLLGVLVILFYLQLEEKHIITTIKRFLLGIAGMLIGLSPFLLLSYVRPRYIGDISQQWLSVLSSGKTNLALPWPLPWRTITPGMSLTEADGHLIIGVLFMSLFAIGLGVTAISALAASRAKAIPPGLAAMTASTAGYLHYAIDRADMEHIGPAFMPVLLGLFLWILQPRQRPLLSVVGVFLVLLPTTRVAARQQSAYHCIRRTIPCEPLQVDRQLTVIAPSQIARKTKSLLEAIRGVDFLALPAYPSLYAMAGQRSPVFDIYAAWPQSIDSQQRAITSIKARPISVVILNNVAFGADSAFELTNPLLYSFLMKEYQICGRLDGMHVLILRKRGLPGCTPFKAAHSSLLSDKLSVPL